MGLDYTKNKVKCVVNHVRKKDVGIFFPHWAQTCGDLKDCDNCYILKPESWDICVKRIRNMTMHNEPVNGWVRKEGVKFEVACHALNGNKSENIKIFHQDSNRRSSGTGGNLVCQCVCTILEGSLGTGDTIRIW